MSEVPLQACTRAVASLGVLGEGGWLLLSEETLCTRPLLLTRCQRRKTTPPRTSSASVGLTAFFKLMFIKLTLWVWLTLTLCGANAHTPLSRQGLCASSGRSSRGDARRQRSPPGDGWARQRIDMPASGLRGPPRDRQACLGMYETHWNKSERARQCERESARER